MKFRSSITLTLIFWCIVTVHCIGIAAGTMQLHYITKPLLVPLLLLLVLFVNSPVPQKKLLVTGLIFSWLGDMFLLFEDQQPFFFIVGLICFLTTHICYIIYFLKFTSPKISVLKKQPLLFVAVVGYGITLVSFLYSHLGALKIPVIVYAIVICTMLLCSLHVFYNVNPPANILYIAGAVFFVASDSLLAINKFYQPFAYAGVWIMLTYCAAQYFIVRGYIKTTAL